MVGAGGVGGQGRGEGVVVMVGGGAGGGASMCNLHLQPGCRLGLSATSGTHLNSQHTPAPDHELHSMRSECTLNAHCTQSLECTLNAH
jgi:hypothetical protein